MSQAITEQVEPRRSREPIHTSDLAGIRAATQWLLGGFAGLALVVAGGIQLSDAWTVVSHRSWRALGTVVGGLAVVIGLFVLVRSAVRVLVPDRASLSDLLADQSREDAGQFGIIVTGATRPDSSEVYIHVRGEIQQARGWLLPAGSDTLDSAYQRYLHCGEEERDYLRASLGEVMAFARTEAALYRFRQLIKLLFRWAGFLVLVGLILLIVSCHATAAEKAPSAAVAAPFAVQVHFTAPQEQLRSRGIRPGCGPTVRGVAVGGTLSEPEVVLDGSGGCPTTKLKVTSDLGVAVPILR